MSDRHFACTQCGRCCNRPPEVELGEAAALADVFAWQLMFRLYSLPKTLAGYLDGKMSREQAGVEFYESKRLLSQFAAHSQDSKATVNGATEDRTFYLTISALALNMETGSCPALSTGRCSIYDRRPLACRTVPLHYSRGEAFAPGDFDAFAAHPDHACETGPDAPLLIQDGRIVAPEIKAAREAASKQADADKRWKSVIIKAIRQGSADLPSMDQIQQHAPVGVITVPMRAAWRAATLAGLMERAEFERLLAAQIDVLDRLARTSAQSPRVAKSLADLRIACAGPI